EASVAAAVWSIAPLPPPQADRGVALQAAALARDDALLIYGASELQRGGPGLPQNRFHDLLTGFFVVPFGKPGSSFLHYSQAYAALGSELRGRKVAVSSTPSSLIDPAADAATYVGNFSRLHALALAF